MPRDGFGTYIRTDGVRTGPDVFQQEEALAINIEASFLDTEAQDMADAITQSLSKDGQTVPTNDLPMGGFKHTGVADASANNQYTTLGQDNSKIAPLVDAAGTADALTASYTPTLPALVNNQVFLLRNTAGPNTVTNPTFNPAGFGAKDIRARGNQALIVGDLGPVNSILTLVYNSVLDYFELTDPRVNTDAYPIGSLYCNATDSTNPATLFGFGTWVAFGEGRIPVGVGTGTDDNGVMRTFNQGDTEGEYVHTLTTGEMPTHSHSVNDPGHSHPNDYYDPVGGVAFPGGGTVGEGVQAPQSSTTGITLGNAGSGNSHNNIQPQIAVYMWVRTA